MMPKKKNEESQEVQSERFQKAVQDMIDAGEIDPSHADQRFDQAIGKILPAKANGND